jgi:site-specific recombinase XerD
MTPIYKSTKDGKVRITMTLDPRKGTEGEMPVCVRVRIVNLQRYFLMPNERYTSEEFASIINEDNRKQGRKRKTFDDFFDKIHREIKVLLEKGELESSEFLETLTNRINGIKETKKTKNKTIYDVWEGLLQELTDANRIGTRNSYHIALKRFRQDMGDKVNNASINQELINKWVSRMQTPKEGKPMNATTIGIYLRAFRVVVRRAVEQGVLMAEKTDLFKGVRAVNKKCSRKNWCLNVEKMTRLYQFFENDNTKDEDGKERFEPLYRQRLFESLGMFLFSYMANGANMADLALLRYDDFYYQQEQKAMRFIRKKTIRESDGMEVIFPILPQMQVILDRIANKPQKGGLVFNIINEGMTDERITAVVACENSNIADRMEVITEMIRMEEKPSPTWCRHSFATNLRDAGISTEYISTMMGHTITSGSATTLNYLSRYNMETMMSYNSNLLRDGEKDKKREEIMKELKGLDTETLATFLKLTKLR